MSAIRSCTSRRDVALQICPLVQKMENMALHPPPQHIQTSTSVDTKEQYTTERVLDNTGDARAEMPEMPNMPDMPVPCGSG